MSVCFLVAVNRLQKDMCPHTPGLLYRKRNITSRKLRGCWNATNADTCAQGEVSLGGPRLTIYTANGSRRDKAGLGGMSVGELTAHSVFLLGSISVVAWSSCSQKKGEGWGEEKEQNRREEKIPEGLNSAKRLSPSSSSVFGSECGSSTLPLPASWWNFVLPVCCELPVVDAGSSSIAS